MTDVTYQNFIKQWKEVTNLPPQRVGALTPVYKRVTARLKIMPWPTLVLGSWFLVLGLYLLLGGGITTLVSLLQRGF